MSHLGWRLPAALLLTAGLALPAVGHEIKVFASQQATPEPGAKATVYLSWGHRVPVDDLIDAATLDRYDLVAPDGSKTRLKADGTSLQANPVKLDQPGLYRAVVARKPSVHTYVFDADGNRVFKRGPKSGVTDGKIDTGIRSVQCGTALIVSGRSGDDAPAPVGLPVEIVPLDGPAGWAVGADVRFVVLIDGKPAAAAPVVARPIGFKPDDAWSYAVTADAKGEFAVRPDAAGTWVLKVNIQRPGPETLRSEFDQESFTATLTLDIRP